MVILNFSAIEFGHGYRSDSVIFLGHLNNSCTFHLLYGNLKFVFFSDEDMQSVPQDPFNTCGKQVKGPPLDPRGHPPFTRYSGFTPGTPIFTHCTSARRMNARIDSGSDK